MLGDQAESNDNFYQFLFQRKRWFVGQNVGNDGHDSLRLANSRLLFERLADLRDVIQYGNLVFERQLREMAFGYNMRTTPLDPLHGHVSDTLSTPCLI